MPQIRFYFDFLSPYSYLASTQLAGVAARTGQTIDYRPINVLQLMERVGNQPTTVLCEAKLHYAFQDLARWAEDYKVPLNPNPHLRTIDVNPLLRGALAAKHTGHVETFIAAVFKGYWIDASSFDSREVLLGMLLDAGISYAGELLEHSDSLQPELDSNIDAAIEDGVFGVPSFVARDRLYFGNDRLHFLERECAA